MIEIDNVHEREIAAPAAAVGRILDSIGSADDKLWASDIWVASPVAFDRPLSVGATGGHGSIRYTVLEYDPGRRLVFEFSPDGALSGTHGFVIDPIGPHRCRMTHVLDARASSWMRPALPILLGWHDAMIETAFDRAEFEASGALGQLTRIPRWLRFLNAMEIGVARLRGKLPTAEPRDRTAVT